MGVDAPVTPLRAVAEALAAVATGVAFLVYRASGAGTLYFAVPCLALWGGYLAARCRRQPALLRQWGLRLDNLRPATMRCLPFFVGGCVVLAAAGLLRGSLRLPWSAAAVFLLYPLWGLVQQLLVQGLVAGNLRRLGLPAPAVIAIAAAAFASVHLPDWRLAGMCALAGAVWTGLFLRTPNLLPLAISHGWLGALAYYWVLGLDPLTQVALGGR